MSVLLVKQEISVSEPTFFRRGLGVTYAIHFYLVRKLIVDFLWVMIKHFSLVLAIEALIRRNPPLLKGIGHFWTKLLG